MPVKCEDPICYMTKEKIFNYPGFQFLLHPSIRDIFQLPDDDDYLNHYLELESWEAPEHIQEAFAYKFAGYDSENRPIWMLALGDYPFRKILEQGEEDIFERYFLQAGHWIAKSIAAKSPEENPSQKAVFIVDAQGISGNQLLHRPLLNYLIKMVHKYKEGALYMLGLAVGINLNRIAVFIINLIRPIVKQVLKRVELYSKDESKWTPRLTEIFDGRDIPDFEGGHRRFPRVVLAPELHSIILELNHPK